MKRSLCLAAAVLALSAPASAALAGDVVVTLTGVQARGGHIVASFDTRDNFLSGRDHQARVENTAAGDVVLTFTDVAPGEYALAVMHDANSDGQFTMSPMGMPEEGWAFSNGDQPIMGPPSFDAHKITVPAEGLRLTERMQYIDMSGMPGGSR